MITVTKNKKKTKRGVLRARTDLFEMDDECTAAAPSVLSGVRGVAPASPEPEATTNLPVATEESGVDTNVARAAIAINRRGAKAKMRTNRLLRAADATLARAAAGTVEQVESVATVATDFPAEPEPDCPLHVLVSYVGDLLGRDRRNAVEQKLIRYRIGSAMNARFEAGQYEGTWPAFVEAHFTIPYRSAHRYRLFFLHLPPNELATTTEFWVLYKKYVPSKEDPITNPAADTETREFPPPKPPPPEPPNTPYTIVEFKKVVAAHHDSSQLLSLDLAKLKDSPSKTDDIKAVLDKAILDLQTVIATDSDTVREIVTLRSTL